MAVRAQDLQVRPERYQSVVETAELRLAMFALLLEKQLVAEVGIFPSKLAVETRALAVTSLSQLVLPLPILLQGPFVSQAEPEPKTLRVALWWCSLRRRRAPVAAGRYK